MKNILVVLATTFLLIMNNVSAQSIKTGDITFATLNTTINSDQPNHLIDAIITDGNYKGAKLHGKLVKTKNDTGGPDRTSLNFTSMNVHGKSKPIKIAAYAIDVNTARTALSSKVSPEYLHHNGIILAAAFIQSFMQKSNQPLSGPKNSYSAKINAGTDIGVLFTAKI